MDYWLQLISLEAHEAGADGLFNDDDEVMLRLNGEMIWEGTMESGDIISFEDTGSSIPFNDFATISLYDEDSGVFGIEEIGGGNDFLGSHTITPTGNGLFTEAVNLNEGGSFYTLVYAVTPGFIF